MNFLPLFLVFLIQKYEATLTCDFEFLESGTSNDNKCVGNLNIERETKEA
jgi:hypothetical protein